METIEIQKSNLQAAYAAADESGKSLLRNLFPDADLNKDNRPVTERIKTFDDALKELGDKHPLVLQYKECFDNYLDGAKNEDVADIVAYLKLRIIVAALNEGWKPEFTEDEWRWYPWFYLYTQEELDDMEDLEKKDHRIIDTGDYQTEYAGFGSACSYYAPSIALAYFGSRLCLRSSELAVYCGKQFIKIWADYNLIRK
jgi:uncharacterized protein YutD